MIIQSIELGLIFGLLITGTWLTSQTIKFDDLTIEGSFCLGGAIAAKLLTLNIPIMITILLSSIAGITAGCITSILHNKLNINNLLSSILTVSIIFSISLVIASPNISLLHEKTIFDLFSFCKSMNKIIPLGIISIAVVFLIQKLLETEIGLCLQVTGDNKSFLKSLGKRKITFETIALGISNGLAALAGALFVQLTGFFSIWSNIGIMVSTLAGLKIAQLFTKKLNLFVLLGGIIFQMIISLTFEFNIMPELQKLISALLVIIFTIILKRNQNA